MAEYYTKIAPKQDFMVTWNTGPLVVAVRVEIVETEAEARNLAEALKFRFPDVSIWSRVAV